jgi:PIN domain nuclease of toxin-antitoxin system
MQIKIQLGKLKLSLPPQRTDQEPTRHQRLLSFAVTLTQVLALDALPFHHKDPFDRLLIAQSIEEDLTLVSAEFSAYSVKLLQ